MLCRTDSGQNCSDSYMHAPQSPSPHVVTSQHVTPEPETIPDQEAQIPHSASAGQMEARPGYGEDDSAMGSDMKGWRNRKGRNDVSRNFRHPQIVTDTLWVCKVDWSSTEFCYSSISSNPQSTQSGHDLRFSAESSSDRMVHKAVFPVSFGMWYKGYCAKPGRRLTVDRSKVSTSALRT